MFACLKHFNNIYVVNGAELVGFGKRAFKAIKCLPNRAQYMTAKYHCLNHEKAVIQYSFLACCPEIGSNHHLVRQ